MKILIAQSYFRILDPKEQNRMMPYPPLGTLYVSTMLRDMGHEIIFFDGMLADSTSELEDLIISITPDLLILYDDEFNYLTKMCLSNMRESAFQISKIAKSMGIKVFIYSSDAMDHSKLYLDNGCDVVIVGEGEETVKELVTNLELNKSFEYVPGIRLYLKDKMDVKQTIDRIRLSDLDILPDPDYNFVDMEKYQKIWLKNHGYFSVNISTSRGCPYSCNWCAKPLYGQNVSIISAERVVKQMLELKEKFQIDHIWFTDDIFGLKGGWLQEFADLITNKDVNIPYKCLSRVDLLLKHDRINLLSKSGCEIVWSGVESGSQKILDAMDKGIQLSEVYEATSQIHAKGFKIAFFIQYGYLGETWEDIIATRKLIKNSLPDDIGISVSYPLPGTLFYNRVKENMSQKTNWEHSDDLDLMYQGTFPSRFYKFLHRFTHAEYNLKRIIKKRKIKKFPLMPYFMFNFVYNRLKMQKYLSYQKKPTQEEIIPIPIGK